MTKLPYKLMIRRKPVDANVLASYATRESAEKALEWWRDAYYPASAWELEIRDPREAQS